MANGRSKGAGVNLPQCTEIAVIGAGLAGSTLAAALATRGRDVVLLERASFPRHKVCGEFLSPESMECLEELGCVRAFYALNPPPMERVRLAVAGGSELEVPLPGRAHGMSRRALDALLFEHAGMCGAAVFDGADVRAIDECRGNRKRLQVRAGPKGELRQRTIEADVVIGAYGRRSRLDRQLSRPFFRKRSPYIAFKRHHRLVDGSGLKNLDGVVELHIFAGGYCGVSYVEDDVVNVCTMFDRRLMNAQEGFGGNEVWEFLGRGDSALARRLSGLEPCDTETLAIAQIPMALKKTSDDEILFVGDSAGMIAPLAGDGQAMAIESGLRLAELLDTHLPHIPRRRWKQVWRRCYEPRIRLGQWLQKAIVEPRISIPVVGLLSRVPAVAQLLIQLTRG